MSKMFRQKKGFTLVEMLVVTLVMSFVSAAAFGVLCATMQQGNVMSNKIDTVDKVRNAFDKIGREMRMGRCIGDLYGNTFQVTEFVKNSETFLKLNLV